MLDARGNVLGAFPIDPFASLVRAVNGGDVVAAAADGRVRRFAPDGTVRWTTAFDRSPTDLAVAVDGSIVATGAHPDGGFVGYLDAAGSITAASSVRTAPFVVVGAEGQLALTSRDVCSVGRPCGADFDPNQPSVPPATDLGGTQTSAVVLLDAAHRTTGGFITSLNDESPVGPLFIRAGLIGAEQLVAQASAISAQRLHTTMDDRSRSCAVALREVDTEATPDHLLGFSGRSLVWDRAIEPLDDSGRAYVVRALCERAGRRPRHQRRRLQNAPPAVARARRHAALSVRQAQRRYRQRRAARRHRRRRARRALRSLRRHARLRRWRRHGHANGERSRASLHHGRLGVCALKLAVLADC